MTNDQQLPIPISDRSHHLVWDMIKPNAQSVPPRTLCADTMRAQAKDA